jgi:hypothetical protein
MTNQQALTLLQEAAVYGNRIQQYTLRKILKKWGATQADLQEGTILSGRTEEQYTEALRSAVKAVEEDI